LQRETDSNQQTPIANTCHGIMSWTHLDLKLPSFNITQLNTNPITHTPSNSM